MTVYAYVMTHDTGFAPCVKDRVLSLATCKTLLRYKIGKNFINSEDIFVIGLCGKQLQARNKIESDFSYSPVFIAKITEVEKTTSYFSRDNGRPDQKYLYENEKWIVKKNNPHHKTPGPLDDSDALKEKDLYYLPRKNSISKENYVLLSSDFAYFGKNLPSRNQLPECVSRICKEREEKFRSDRTPIELENCYKFAEWFLKNSSKQLKDIKDLTIDNYFDSNGCK